MKEEEKENLFIYSSKDGGIPYTMHRIIAELVELTHTCRENDLPEIEYCIKKLEIIHAGLGKPTPSQLALEIINKLKNK